MLNDCKLLRTLAQACRQGGNEGAYLILMAASAYLTVGVKLHRVFGGDSAHSQFWSQPE